MILFVPVNYEKMSPVPISQKFRLVGLEVEKVASA